MSTKTSFKPLCEILIGKKNNHGGYDKLVTGKLYHIGATFSMIAPMTEHEHETISTIAWNLYYDLVEYGISKDYEDFKNYRVSIFNLKGES